VVAVDQFNPSSLALRAVHANSSLRRNRAQPSPLADLLISSEGPFAKSSDAAKTVP
jgi:hypothetical protein